MSFIQKSNNFRELSRKYSECIALMHTQENDINLIQSALAQSYQDIASSNQKPNLSLMLLHELIEKLNTYPCFPNDKPTLEHLNIFYNDREQHHTEILLLINTYLPETYAELKSINQQEKRFI